MAPGDDAINSENTPLLRSDSKSAVIEASVWELKVLSGREKLKQTFRTWETTIICCLLVFFADLGNYTFEAPFLRETELMICREHYLKTDPSLIDSHGNVLEHFCKTDSISQDLAILRGWLATLDNVSGVVVAVPFGVLADRYGRRRITFVALVGEMLAVAWQLLVFRNYHVFGSKVLMAGCAFRLIGGGSSVIVALLLALIANSLSAERRSEAFFYFLASAVGAELAGTPLAAILMTKASNWTALMVGYIVLGFSTPLIWLAPEKQCKKADVSTSEIQPHDGTSRTSEAGSTKGPNNAETNGLTDYSSQLWQKWKSAAVEARHSFHLLFQNRNVLLGLLAFLSSRFSSQLIYITPQYVSKRYGWSIAKANILSSFRAGVQLLVLALLLPILTSYLHAVPHRYSGPRTDALIARFSVTFLILGCLICGFALSPPLMALGLVCFTVGYGYRAALQSFMSASVNAGSLAQLYVAVSVVDTISNILAAQLLALSLARGIRGGGGRAIGGPGSPGGGVPEVPPGGSTPGNGEAELPGEVVSKWIGLPYLVAAATFLITGLFTIGLNVQEAEACSEANQRDTDEEEVEDRGR